MKKTLDVINIITDSDIRIQSITRELYYMINDLKKEDKKILNNNEVKSRLDLLMLSCENLINTVGDNIE